MLTRVLSGIVLATGIVTILLFTPPWGLGLVVTLALVLAAREFQAIAHPEADRVDFGFFLTALVLTAAWPLMDGLWPGYTQAFALCMGFGLIALLHLFRPDPIDDRLRRLSADTLGLAYIGLTFPLIFLLRDRPDGGWVVVVTMAITFGADTGAYFAGRFFGRHKLYEKVSPKKTIEGAVGGMAAGIGFAFLGRAIAPGLGDLTPLDTIILGGVGAALGIVGDLFESLLKRSSGVKDSGDLIPGHGGVLDRIDALLFVGPFVYLYLEHLRP